MCRWGGIFEHPAATRCAAQQELLNLLDIALVTHGHHRVEKHLAVAQREVFHPLGDQFLVGNNGFAPVDAADHRVAGFDVRHAALKTIHFDVIADPQAALKQNHKAADVIGREFLQTEAEAHAQSTAQDRQRRQIHAEAGQGEQQTHK